MAMRVGTYCYWFHVLLLAHASAIASRDRTEIQTPCSGESPLSPIRNLAFKVVCVHTYWDFGGDAYNVVMGYGEATHGKLQDCTR